MRKNKTGWRRGHSEVGQHSPKTNILALVPRERHNTIQHKHRNEAKVWAQTVERDQDCPRPLKLSSPLPEISERMDCARWVICTKNKKPDFLVRKPIY